MKKLNLILFGLLISHMLEAQSWNLFDIGTDIRFIQHILGHSNIQTTQIYTHVSTTHISKINNPSDNMNIL